MGENIGVSTFPRVFMFSWVFSFVCVSIFCVLYTVSVLAAPYAK